MIGSFLSHHPFSFCLDELMNEPSESTSAHGQDELEDQTSSRQPTSPGPQSDQIPEIIQLDEPEPDVTVPETLENLQEPTAPEVFVSLFLFLII